MFEFFKRHFGTDMLMASWLFLISSVIYVVTEADYLWEDPDMDETDKVSAPAPSAHLCCSLRFLTTAPGGDILRARQRCIVRSRQHLLRLVVVSRGV